MEPAERSKVRRQVIKLAIPCLIESLSDTLIFYVDTIMIGRIGREAMAAMGITGPVMYTLFAVLTALGVGALAVIARATGEKDEAKQRRVIWTSLFVASVIGIIASIIGYTLMHRAAYFFNLPDNPNVAVVASRYIQIIGAVMFFYIIHIVTGSLIRGLGKTQVTMIIGLIANAINIIGNWLLIYGNLGFPRLEVVGAAYASAIAIIVYALLSVWYLFTRFPVSNISGFISKETFRSLMKVTIPAFVEPLILQSGFLIYVKIISLLGEIQLAAHRTAIAIESLSFLQGYAISIACSALVGQSLGRKRPDEANTVFQESVRISLYFSGIMALLFLILPELLMKLFIPGEPSVIAIGALCLAISALEQPFLAMAMIYSGTLKGAGDTIHPVFVAFIGVWLIRVPFSYLLAFPFGLGLNGVWITMIFDWLVRTIIFYFIYKRGAWQRIKL